MRKDPFCDTILENWSNVSIIKVGMLFYENQVANFV